ncbi:DUF6691 family protein [Limibacter armeniacum]|uniref:DUF6691 family protein n=1 Tax=Limibacter armeniacum TaxID=466084 RepID=UPI002FE6230C
MKFKIGIRYILIGVLFGIVMTKSEAVSWFRIQEMFRFQSFHMYGIIGSALLTGIVITAVIKRFGIRDVYGETIKFHDKEKSISRYLIGGTIFGLGWALTGACPGPMFVLLGHGFLIMFIVILSAITGTFVYGLLRDKLPH